MTSNRWAIYFGIGASAVDEDVGDLGDDGTNGGEGGDELLFVVGLVGDVGAEDEQGGGLDGGLGEQHPCFVRTPSSVSSNPRLTRMF